MYLNGVFGRWAIPISEDMVFSASLSSSRAYGQRTDGINHELCEKDDADSTGAWARESEDVVGSEGIMPYWLGLDARKS